MATFLTIGHSNRSLDEFAALLRDALVQQLVDVRAFPRSRTNPQFNKETLPEGLAPFHISYLHILALGGRRGRSNPVPAQVNGFWSNRSFHNYADYAFSEDFQLGMDQLIAQGHQHRCAIMCSEAVWWRCHRRIIADYLIARGETVVHIVSKGRMEQARLTAGAVIQPGGTVIYPAVGA